MTPISDIITFTNSVNGTFHLMRTPVNFAKNAWYCKIKLENDGLKLEVENHAETAAEAAHNAYIKAQLIYSKVPTATFNNNILEAPKPDDNMPF